MALGALALALDSGALAALAKVLALVLLVTGLAFGSSYCAITTPVSGGKVSFI